jgi:linoleoyl-CoA desaturase
MQPGSTPPTDPTPVPAHPPDGPGPDAEGAPPGGDGSRRRKVTFAKDAAGFLTELRRGVEDYFARTGKGKTDSWQMYLKSAIVLTVLAASYVLLVVVADAWWQAVPLAVLLGVSMALVGFNIQHDGGHGSYSRHPWVNRAAAMTLDLVGASSYLWHWKHVVYHHTYVNVYGEDTDIDVSSLVRFTPHARRLKMQRYQHLYLWPLYGLMASRWHLYGDFKEVVTGTIGPHPIPRPRGRDLLTFVAGKVVSIGLLLVLPMFFHPWWLVLAFYLLVTFVLGVVLSVVFQLAHCVEEAAFPMPVGDPRRMEAAWAVHQAEATVDFARNSRVLAWLLGGLNFQIEHHLFPTVCHVHYPAICKIVEQTCRDFGVKYAEHRTFWSGIASHYRWLRHMGELDGDQGPHAGHIATSAFS